MKDNNTDDTIFNDEFILCDSSFLIKKLIASDFAFTAQQAVEALYQLSSAGNLKNENKERKNKKMGLGLGEVYWLISCYYEKTRLLYLLKKLEYFLHKKSNILTRFFKRRTTKTTLHPVRLKGWKQRR